MNFATRLWRHLYAGPLERRTLFPEAVLTEIESSIAASERTHRSEVKFCVEGGFDLATLLSSVTPRERAVNLFSDLRVWDTQENSGVLLYVLVAEHRIEIVADRGITALLGEGIWDEVCREIEHEFRQHRFQDGVLKGIARVSQLLQTHFPVQGPNTNELADRPVVL